MPPELPASRELRAATAGDVPACLGIYNAAVASTLSTFDLDPQGPELFAPLLASAHPFDRYLVAEVAGEVVGYAYAHAYRARPAYDGTRETSIYLAEAARGRGLGRRLYAALLGELDAAGCRTQLAVIALPNDASEALHRAFGFEHAGTLRQVGRKFGRWVDTAWYQRLPG